METMENLLLFWLGYVTVISHGICVDYADIPYLSEVLRCGVDHLCIMPASSATPQSVCVALHLSCSTFLHSKVLKP